MAHRGYPSRVTSHASRLLALKALGFVLCLVAAAGIGFVFGVDRTWDTAEKVTAMKLRDDFREAYRDGKTFTAWEGELVFYPWRQAAKDRPTFSMAGAGYEGPTKRTER